jgi:hypothetical protein
MNDYKQLEPIKQGDTFEIWADYSADGAAEIFDPSELMCTVRNPVGTAMCNLTVSAGDVPGRYVLNAGPTVTIKWPVGYVLLDIKRTKGNGEVTRTETMSVVIDKAVTK